MLILLFGKKNLKQDELGLIPFAGECSFLIYFNTYPQRFCGDIEHFEIEILVFSKKQWCYSSFGGWGFQRACWRAAI